MGEFDYLPRKVPQQRHRCGAARRRRRNDHVRDRTPGKPVLGIPQHPLECRVGMHNHPLFIDSEGGNRKPLEQPQRRKLLQIAQRGVRVRPSPAPTRPCRRPPPSHPADQHIEPCQTEQWRQRRSSARSWNYRCLRSSVTSTFTGRTLSNNFGAKQHTFSPCVIPTPSARLSAGLCVSFIGPLSPRHKSIPRAAIRRQSDVITESICARAIFDLDSYAASPAAYGGTISLARAGRGFCRCRRRVPAA